MTHSRRIAILATALSLVAAQAGAVSISLNQVGGTATNGRGQIGDTVVLSIDVVLDAGDDVTILAPSIQWDTEGGNVLDLVSATEVLLNPTAGADLWRINGRYRYGVLGEIGDLFGDLDSTEVSFPAGPAGASFAWGWEAVTLDAAGGIGPVSFSIGTAEFVLTDPGTTNVSFMLDGFGPWNTLVFAAGFANDITEDVELGNVTLGTLAIQVVPEPGTGALLALGLAYLATARRRGR